MNFSLEKILKELNLRKPADPGKVNIIWLSNSNLDKFDFDIDFNRSLDSIHGAVNDERGFYLSDGRIWELEL